MHRQADFKSCLPISDANLASVLHTKKTGGSGGQGRSYRVFPVKYREIENFEFFFTKKSTYPIGGLCHSVGINMVEAQSYSGLNGWKKSEKHNHEATVGAFILPYAQFLLGIFVLKTA